MFAAALISILPDIPTGNVEVIDPVTEFKPCIARRVKFEEVVIKLNNMLLSSGTKPNPTEPLNLDQPASTHRAYLLVIVILAPAAGELAINTVAAFVVVTPVFVAAKVGCANELNTAHVAVPDVAVLLFVLVPA